MLAAFATALALALVTGAANANRSIAAETPRANTSRSRVTFTTREATYRVIAENTLNSRLAVTLIAKTRGASFFTITECIMANVRVEGLLLGSGTARCDLATPYRVVYNSFLGVLPNITGILGTIKEMAWLIETRSGGVRNNACLYKGDISILISESGGGRTFNQFMVLPGAGAEANLATELEPELAIEPCPARSSLSGTWTLEPGIAVHLV